MKYIGITFGPIGGMMEQLRRSKQLWAASFFFSEWSRLVFERVRASIEGEVLIPQSNDEDDIRRYGAGAFPDRIVIRTSDEHDWQHVQRAIAEVDLLHGEGVLRHLDRHDHHHEWRGKTAEEMAAIIRSKCYARAVEIDASKGWSALHNALDQVEQVAPIPANGAYPLPLFFELQNRGEGDDESYLMHGVGRAFRQYEAIADIAGDTPYIAVIHADGNGVGKHVSNLIEQGGDVTAFSDRLSSFAGWVGKAIVEFGGRALFIGGDDVLAFMPLSSKDGSQSLFQFIEQANQQFAQKIAQPNLSMRWGISIGYYKHPLLALYRTAFAMSDAARGASSRAAICLQKHSGQQVKWTMDLTGPIWNERLSQFELSRKVEGDRKFFSGIMHQLENPTFKELLALASADAAREERIRSLFQNTFNESIHQTDEAQAFIETIIRQLVAGDGNNNEGNHSSTYGWLRMIQFISNQERS